jgi:hypothetical protein
LINHNWFAKPNEESGEFKRPLGSRKREQAGHDHKHRLRTVRPYEYTDAAALLAAFWSEVESVMREKGVWT